MQILRRVEKLEALLIEDNPDDGEFLAKHLGRVKNRKVHITTCELLADGLERLSHGGIDIVFLDLALPDSTGIHTVTRVRSIAPTVPIVVMTGSDDDELAMSALEFGAQDYLIKGHLDPSTLSRSISYAIERQKNDNTSQWLKSIIEGSNEAIVGKLLDNTIASWNKGAEKIYGYKAAEIIGKSASLLIPPGRCNDFATILEKLKRSQEIQPYETRRLTKDGKEIVVYLSVSPVYDSDGKLSGVSTFARDITEQKRTEDLLKLAVGASRLGLWDYHLSTGNMQWDSGMCRLFDLAHDKAEFSIESFIEQVHEDDQQRVKEIFDSKRVKTGEFAFDFRVRWSDGTVHDLESRGEVFSDDNGRPLSMAGVCSDVTDRKVAENALIQTDQRLRLALDSARMGVWDWDLKAETIWRSPRHDEIFGYDTMLPKWSYETFLEHVALSDREKVQKGMAKAFEQGHFELKCRIKTPDHSQFRWIWVQGETHCDDQGNAMRMLGTITDVTKSKQLEQQARQSRQKREQISQAIVEHAPIGIVMLDENFKVSGANSKFASMIQTKVSKLLDCPFTTILPSQAIAIAKEFVGTPTPMQAPRLFVQIPQQKQNPNRYWNLSLWPVADDHGQFSGAAMQVVDITDVVLLEQQRDDFVASVAHDIKNPLLGADKILDLLCEQTKNSSDENMKKMLVVLKDSNTNLLSLVQNLVAVYRFEKGGLRCVFEDVNLQALIESCLLQVSDLARRQDIELILTLRDCPTVQADSIGLNRVVMNLLHNAIKFSNKNGTVTIVVEHHDKNVSIAITDTGPGISKSDQQLLFHRFTQLPEGRRYTGGTGLGLFLSKQIIDLHHGIISVQSELGKGATFTVTIPVLNTHDDD